MYNRFAGGQDRALRLLERSLADPGNASSADVVWVAEVDGRVAGAMAAFPVDEAVARSAAFLRLALRAAPPWRWPQALMLYWAGGRAAPSPPSPSFYVDALATDPALRRRGAAAPPVRSWRRPSARLAGAGCPRSRSTPPSAIARPGRCTRALSSRRSPTGRPAAGCRGSCARQATALTLITSRSAATTCSISPSLSSPKKGSASDRRATSSHTGNSPSR
jgi:hypothetical protein